MLCRSGGKGLGAVCCCQMLVVEYITNACVLLWDVVFWSSLPAHGRARHYSNCFSVKRIPPESWKLIVLRDKQYKILDTFEDMTLAGSGSSVSNCTGTRSMYDTSTTTLYSLI